MALADGEVDLNEAVSWVGDVRFREISVLGLEYLDLVRGQFIAESLDYEVVCDFFLGEHFPVLGAEDHFRALVDDFLALLLDRKQILGSREEPTKFL